LCGRDWVILETFPDHSYISQEEETMLVFKVSKDRLTILLGGNAAADYKIKSLLAYLSENPSAFKNISKASLLLYGNLIEKHG
jgi:hypothetical protein